MAKLTVHTSFPFIAWLLYFFTPIIEIKGKEYRSSWGKRKFEMKPGSYTIRIWFKYFWIERCGYNEITFDLHEGDERTLKYRMPPWISAKGKMTLK